jgi:hypothetical protein
MAVDEDPYYLAMSQMAGIGSNDREGLKASAEQCGWQI